MAIDRISLLFISSLLVCGCGEPDTAPPALDDQSWDEASSEQRSAHLHEVLEANLEILRTTEDADRWRAASGQAIRSLSLLRVEDRDDDREAYAELEAEVERLTDEPPPLTPPR